MKLGLSLSLAGSQGGSAPPPFADGWISAARISLYGWFMEIDIPDTYQNGTFDFSKLALTVTDFGFTSGVLGTRQRTLHVTNTLRVPGTTGRYENISGGLSTFRLSLSEQVYSKAKAGDGFSGTNPILVAQAGFYSDGGSDAPAATVQVTNLSGMAYQKPVFRNALPPRRWLEGSTAKFEVTGNSAQAMSGRTVDCAQLILTGDTSSHTETVNVTAMMASDYYTKRVCAAPVFQAVATMTGFTQSETVTERWKIYPWIGDTPQDSADGSYAAGDFANHSHLCDKGSTYGKVWAVVNATSGNDTTGAASTVSEAAAASTPFATDKKALEAAQALNNSTHGKNNVSGVILCFSDETHTLQLRAVAFGTGGANFDAGECNVGPTWCIYRPVTGHAGNCKFLRNTANTNAVPFRTVIRDIKLDLNDTHASTTIMIDCEETNTGTKGVELWLDNSPVIDSGAANTKGGLYRCGKVWLTNTEHTSISANALGQGNVRHNIMLLRDINFPNAVNGGLELRALVGVNVANYKNSGSIGLLSTALTNMLVPQDGIVVAGTIIRAVGHSTNHLVRLSAQTVTAGVAFLNVLLEVANNGSQGALYVSGDGDNYRHANFFADYLTVVGGRVNIGYEDTFVMTDDGDGYQQLKHHLLLRRSVVREFNTKTDLFTTANASRIHAWNVSHRVGWKYVRMLETAADGSTSPGNGAWCGDAWTNTISYIGPDARSQFTSYAADHRSPAVTGAGGGNYKPISSSVLLDVIPANDEACPVDIVGTTRDGAVGAYEYVA